MVDHQRIGGRTVAKSGRTPKKLDEKAFKKLKEDALDLLEGKMPQSPASAYVS